MKDDQPSDLGALEHGELQPQIAELNRHLASLSGQVTDSADPQVLDASLRQLSRAIEELEVASEELQSRTEAIAEAQIEIDVIARRYRDLFDFAPDGYLVTNTAGIIVEANRAASELFGTSERVLLGNPIVVFADAADRQLLLEALRSVLRERAEATWDVDVCMAPPDSVPFHASVRISAPHPAHRQDALVRWLIRDISLKVRAERALAASEARYRLLADNSADVVLTTDPAGHITYASPSSWHVLRWEPKLLEGESLVGFVHQSDRSSFKAALGPTREDKALRTLTSRIRKGDGRYMPMEATLGPLINAEGACIGLRVSLRDVREREKARTALEAALTRELETSAALRRADSIKNTLLLAASHDLRNPAAAAGGMAEVLFNNYDSLSEQDVRRIGEGLTYSTQQINSIISNLLDAERLEEGELTIQAAPANLTEIVAERAQAAGLGADRVLLPTEAMEANVDPGLTASIVDNLVNNATRHASNGTPVRVGLTRRGEKVMLTVDNEGASVPDQEKEAIFEPFRRRPASPGDGLGLGLYLVRRFAELQHGRAWVEDLPGGGCSFRVLLPLLANGGTGGAARDKRAAPSS